MARPFRVFRVTVLAALVAALAPAVSAAPARTVVQTSPARSAQPARSAKPARSACPVPSHNAPGNCVVHETRNNRPVAPQRGTNVHVRPTPPPPHPATYTVLHDVYNPAHLAVCQQCRALVDQETLRHVDAWWVGQQSRALNARLNGAYPPPPPPQPKKKRAPRKKRR